MTKKEAIYILRNAAWLGSDADRQKVEEAVEVVAKAIEELEGNGVAQERKYTFGNDEFNLEYAYHDCKLVFDEITDDDSFQEADTGLILYYANEIIYALHEALKGKDTNVPSADTDTISRQATITEIKNYERDSTAPINYVKIVEQMPPAQPDARYINANELIKRLQQAGLDDAVSIAVKMAGHERLKHVPSAQPELIRCKDCKWWGYDDDDGAVRVCHAAKHGHMSSNWSIMIYRTHKGDFYCADAERCTDAD